ncbi:Caprin family member 2 [Plakobranchus ocellatus]|uniref:Caprin family member 2 n=1 Tax=Plakobranchus ocellatus TaxID=259542 RepID=A0AAV4C4J2_9GAST|nr:Caprin family member 2 [Plakobranchus ocellatus]
MASLFGTCRVQTQVMLLILIGCCLYQHPGHMAAASVSVSQRADDGQKINTTFAETEGSVLALTDIESSNGIQQFLDNFVSELERTKNLYTKNNVVNKPENDRVSMNENIPIMSGMVNNDAFKSSNNVSFIPADGREDGAKVITNWTNEGEIEKNYPAIFPNKTDLSKIFSKDTELPLESGNITNLTSISRRIVPLNVTWQSDLQTEERDDSVSELSDNRNMSSLKIQSNFYTGINGHNLALERASTLTDLEATSDPLMDNPEYLQTHFMNFSSNNFKLYDKETDGVYLYLSSNNQTDREVATNQTKNASAIIENKVSYQYPDKNTFKPISSGRYWSLASGDHTTIGADKSGGQVVSSTTDSSESLNTDRFAGLSASENEEAKAIPLSVPFSSSRILAADDIQKNSDLERKLHVDETKQIIYSEAALVDYDQTTQSAEDINSYKNKNKSFTDFGSTLTNYTEIPQKHRSLDKERESGELLDYTATAFAHSQPWNETLRLITEQLSVFIDNVTAVTSAKTHDGLPEDHQSLPTASYLNTVGVRGETKTTKPDSETTSKVQDFSLISHRDGIGRNNRKMSKDSLLNFFGHGKDSMSEIANKEISRFELDNDTEKIGPKHGLSVGKDIDIGALFTNRQMFANNGENWINLQTDRPFQANIFTVPQEKSAGMKRETNLQNSTSHDSNVVDSSTISDIQSKGKGKEIENDYQNIELFNFSFPSFPSLAETAEENTIQKMFNKSAQVIQISQTNQGLNTSSHPSTTYTRDTSLIANVQTDDDILMPLKITRSNDTMTNVLIQNVNHSVELPNEAGKTAQNWPLTTGGKDQQKMPLSSFEIHPLNQAMLENNYETGKVSTKMSEDLGGQYKPTAVPSILNILDFTKDRVDDQATTLATRLHTVEQLTINSEFNGKDKIIDKIDAILHEIVDKANLTHILEPTSAQFRDEASDFDLEMNEKSGRKGFGSRTLHDEEANLKESQTDARDEILTPFHSAEDDEEFLTNPALHRYFSDNTADVGVPPVKVHRTSRTDSDQNLNRFQYSTTHGLRPDNQNKPGDYMTVARLEENPDSAEMYPGLGDIESQELDQWIRDSDSSNLGPVRTPRYTTMDGVPLTDRDEQQNQLITDIHGVDFSLGPNSYMNFRRHIEEIKNKLATENVLEEPRDRGYGPSEWQKFIFAPKVRYVETPDSDDTYYLGNHASFQNGDYRAHQGNSRQYNVPRYAKFSSLEKNTDYPKIDTQSWEVNPSLYYSNPKLKANGQYLGYGAEVERNEALREIELTPRQTKNLYSNLNLFGRNNNLPLSGFPTASTYSQGRSARDVTDTDPLQFSNDNESPRLISNDVWTVYEPWWSGFPRSPRHQNQRNITPEGQDEDGDNSFDSSVLSDFDVTLTEKSEVPYSDNSFLKREKLFEAFTNKETEKYPYGDGSAYDYQNRVGDSTDNMNDSPVSYSAARIGLSRYKKSLREQTGLELPDDSNDRPGLKSVMMPNKSQDRLSINSYIMTDNASSHQNKPNRSVHVMNSTARNDSISTDPSPAFHTKNASVIYLSNLIMNSSNMAADGQIDLNITWLEQAPSLPEPPVSSNSALPEKQGDGIPMENFALNQEKVLLKPQFTPTRKNITELFSTKLINPFEFIIQENNDGETAHMTSILGNVTFLGNDSSQIPDQERDKGAEYQNDVHGVLPLKAYPIDVPEISAYKAQDFSLREPSTINSGNTGQVGASFDSSGYSIMSSSINNNSTETMENYFNISSNSSLPGTPTDLSAQLPLLPMFRARSAVSAVLTSHFGPTKDRMIPFDLELLDVGDNYDNTSGTFICTIPGTYVIALHLMAHPGAKVNARVHVNSRPIAALWADDNGGAGFYPSSSTHTLAHLDFGDQVYVMLVDGGLLSPPSGQSAGGGARTRDRRVSAELRAGSLTTEPPTPQTDREMNNYIKKFSDPPSAQGAGFGARTRDRRVSADIRTDSLATVPPTTPIAG